VGEKRAAISKDEIYWKVLRAAMSLDFKKGHCRWTIAGLSRVSGVSRPLIYYYFGKNREDILLAAVKVIGEECFGLSPKRMKLWKEGDLCDSVRQSRAFVQDHQDLAAFYFAQRSKPHFVGIALRELEAQYAKKLKNFFRTQEDADIQRKLALFFGLVFAPGISDEAIASISDRPL